MRTLILSLLLVVALIAIFNVAEAKSESELLQTPSALQSGKDKVSDKKAKKHTRRKGSKHHKDNERKKGKKRRHKCNSDSDCRHGKKCVAGRKGKMCKVVKL